MSKDISIVDIVIHVHPELSEEQHTNLQQAVHDCDGVLSDCFMDDHPHVFTVAYNPDLISSEEVLKQVRTWDPEATMAGI